jgi:two-component system OmpR family sensor kinase
VRVFDIERVFSHVVERHERDAGSRGIGLDIHIAPSADQLVGDGSRLSVIDSGVGISPEHLDHVFDRFYKVDASRTGGADGGSGLGQSIAKAIVALHGGTIDVLSRPGRTEFRIVLPGQSASANL